MKYFTDNVDKELMRQWAADLRSGKYKQGNGLLYNKGNNSYCCLGVLGIRLGIPQENLERWRSFLSCGPVYGEPDEKENVISTIKRQDLFSTLNDIESKDFNYIADEIEKDLDVG